MRLAVLKLRFDGFRALGTYFVFEIVKMTEVQCFCMVSEHLGLLKVLGMVGVYTPIEVLAS